MTSQDPPGFGAAAAGQLPSATPETPVDWASLSALADGRREACDAALSAWSSSAQARAAWHELQLIGDVLRSDELASPVGHDELFLQRLRLRLETEPTILAPMAIEQGASLGAGARGQRLRRRSAAWSYGAVAAGFVAVGSVVLMLNGPSSLPSAPSVLAGSGPSSASARVAAGVPLVQRVSAEAQPVLSAGSASVAANLGADPEWRTLDGKVIRDARLDAYLHAHRGSSAVAGRFQTVVLER